MTLIAEIYETRDVNFHVIIFPYHSLGISLIIRSYSTICYEIIQNNHLHSFIFKRNIYFFAKLDIFYVTFMHAIL